MGRFAWILNADGYRLSRVQRLLFAAGASIAVAMVLLAYTMSDRIAASAVKAASDQTALLIGAFVEPLVQDLETSNKLDPDAIARLDKLVAEQFRDRVQILKVWLRDGTLVYSSNKKMVGERLPAQPPRATLQGEVVGFFDKIRGLENVADVTPHSPLIEIYVPLYKAGTKQLIAVGEFYTNGERIAAELRTLRFAAMGIVGIIMIPMMGALMLLVIQANWSVEAHQEKLTRKIAETEELAQQNERLRLVSEESRLEAATSNERLLEQIGQDLHDGPVQLLSLLVLKLSAPKVNEAAQIDGPMQPAELATTILKEVRDISTGLVLPQLEGFTITETIREAIRYHKMTTGIDVEHQIDDLPDDLGSAVKICIFRALQEALNNGFHHANGAGQSVEAFADEKFLTVAIKNAANGINPQSSPKNSKISLGLSGIRRRVEALSGTLEIASENAHGTTVTAKIPIAQNLKTA